MQRRYQILKHWSIEERGSIPYTFTDTEADKYYYALQEDSASIAQSVSKGPSAMGGRGFGSRRQEMEAQLPVTKHGRQLWYQRICSRALSITGLLRRLTDGKMSKEKAKEKAMRIMNSRSLRRASMNLINIIVGIRARKEAATQVYMILGSRALA